MTELQDAIDITRTLTLLCAALMTPLALAACQTPQRGQGTTIAQAQEELTESLLLLEGVVGTGLGESEGEPCITVMVSQPTQAILDQIPSTLRGYPVVVVETGELQPHAIPPQ